MSTRRVFLKGLAAGAFTAGSQSLLSPAFAKGRPPVLFPNLTQGISKLLLKNDVIAVSDTDHLNDAMVNALQDPGLLYAARKSGVKDIYIEISPEHQPQFDRLAQGRIHMDDFKDLTAVKTIMAMEHAGLTPGTLGLDLTPRGIFARQMETYGTFAIQAAKAGIKIHCADIQPLGELYNMTHKMKTREDAAFIGMKDRLEKYDHLVARMIQKTRTGKAMVVYGFLHTALDWAGKSEFHKGLNIVQSLNGMGAKVGKLHISSHPLDETRDFYTSGGRDGRLGLLIKDFHSWLPEKLIKPDLIYDVETDEIEELAASLAEPARTLVPAPALP